MVWFDSYVICVLVASAILFFADSRDPHLEVNPVQDCTKIPPRAFTPLIIQTSHELDDGNGIDSVGWGWIYLNNIDKATT